MSIYKKTYGIPRMVPPVYTSQDETDIPTEDEFAVGEYTYYNETIPDGKKDSASAMGAMICGILSLTFCLAPIVPLVLGVISVILYKENERQVLLRREYNTGTANAGHICAVLGIIINFALYLILISVAIIGIIIS